MSVFASAAWLEAWPALPVARGESRVQAAARVLLQISMRRESGGLIEIENAMVGLRREPWDCDRLEIEAGKLELLLAANERAGHSVLQNALERARREGLLHLTCRVDTRDTVTTAALGSAGLSLRDVVVTLSLEKPDRLWSFPEGVREAKPSDAEALADLSARSFAEPGDSYNRYANDPNLSREQVRRVYGHWAKTSVAGPAADKTFVIEERGELLGFVTLKLPQAGVARVPLNAVDSKHRGRGLYKTLVLAVTAAAFAAGAESIEIVTQLQQLAVQRAWWCVGAKAIGSATSWTAWLGP